MNAKILLRALWSWTKQNSTKLLACGAIGAEVLGYYFMHREAPIVRDRLDALGADATLLDKIKAAGPVYLPAAGMLVLSAGCIIGGCAIGESRVAMMAGLYSASEATLRKYEEKMLDTLGEEKAQKMHDEVSKELEDGIGKTYNPSQVEYTTHGGHLFYDNLSSRFFTSSEAYVLKAAETINSKIYNRDSWVSVNEWYDELGIRHAKLAGPFGWNIDHKLQVSFYADRTEDGTLYDVIVYFDKPRLYNGKLPKNYDD